MVATARGALWRAPDGTLERLTGANVGLRAAGNLPLVCHAPAVAARLGLENIPAFDLLELFAFVRPARFCLPTVRGLCEVLGLLVPATPEEVFDAYTDAEQQRIWFSILDERPGIVEIEVDLRVGGRQTAVWGASPDELFRETQTFLVIDRPHRLSFTWTIAGEADQDGSRVDIAITPTSTGCELRLVHTLPRAWADYTGRTQQGWSTMLDALHAVF